MRRAYLLPLLVAATFVPTRAATDALSDVRAALGGDAALEGVKSIHATGKIVTGQGARDGTIEVYFQYPDRFARVTRTALNPAGAPPGADRYGRTVDSRLPADRGEDPFDYSHQMPDLTTNYTVTTTRTGFSGNARISDGGRGGQQAGSGIVGINRQYAAFAIPLVASLTASYPATVTSSADTVHFNGADGVDWVLTLDAATHLPATLTWSSGQTVLVMTLSDYRQIGRVVWPFRIVTRASNCGAPTSSAKPVGSAICQSLNEDVTIKKYEINTKIGDKVFALR